MGFWEAFIWKLRELEVVRLLSWGWFTVRNRYKWKHCAAAGNKVSACRVG